ncbi:MAG: hypothetical protein OXI88_00185 [Gammaproteobacteria bacterium]|nr:hypothetical protein [Gammaproteobacteria bacterium]MDE0510197.1 hypothetical protein [Gammaproteobacteria bacterium]
MTDNTKQENPPGNGRPDIDKLLGEIEKFEKYIEPALAEKSNGLEEKSALVRDQMDEAISSIREYMLGDVHKTTDDLKDSYEESVKKLTGCIEQAEQSHKACEEELTRLDEEYQSLNDFLEKRPGTQQVITSFFDRIRACWYLLMQDKVKRAKAASKLRGCRRRINRYKARLQGKEATFNAAKQVKDYYLPETPNIDAFLKKSDVHVKWGAVLVAVIYMSVYLSKLFASHLYGLEAFLKITGVEVTVLVVAGLCFFRRSTPQKVFVPIAILSTIPVLHSLYLLQAAGDFLRTSGLASASNIDPSFFFFLFVLLVIYGFRSRFLCKFNASIVIAGIEDNTDLNKLIDNRFRLLLWRLWFWATVALVIVSMASTASTALSSTNEQQVDIDGKKYTLVMQLKDRLILVDPECRQPDIDGGEECKFFSVLSAEIPCLGPIGACPTLPEPSEEVANRETFIDKVMVKELTVNKAAVTDGLVIGSIRAESGQVDNLTVRLATGAETGVPLNEHRHGIASYEKLMDCLDETKTGGSGAFRVDFLFCKNTSKNPVLTLIAPNGKTKRWVLGEIDDLKTSLPQSTLAGEYHYIGTASDPGAWENNFQLGKERLEFVIKNVAPQGDATVHKWPFGPLPLIELEQLVPKAKMKELKAKINGKCPAENSTGPESPEQIIQQFAQVVYCPVVNR